MDHSSSRLSSRHVSSSQYQPDSYNASSEPLVEDFNTRFISHVQSPGVSSLPGIETDYPAYPSFDSANDDDGAAPAPELSRRNMNAASRSSGAKVSKRASFPASLTGVSSSSNSPKATEYRDYPDQSSNGSMSDASTAPTELPPLQTKGPPDESDRLEPVVEDDPRNFDLLAAPPEQATGVYALEARAELLFSQEHLRLIFQDSRQLLHFTGFLNSHRPRSVRTLVYYLDSLKALRAIEYANAVTEALEPLRDLEFTKTPVDRTINKSIRDRANKAFEELAREDLPAFIAYTWIQVVSESIHKRITGTLAPHLREASEGLAEVFCLSDPSRPDNPIVFASEEFQRTTQYGMGYCVGRNCRFLQGPKTNRNSVRRLSEACKAGKEHSEVFLNYRRDGSPFMNLLMTAPLHDAKGTVRYFIGAQVDVSGLVKDGTDLEALQRLVARDQDPEAAADEDRATRKDEFQELSEMFNIHELETVRKHGGRMHRDQVDDDDDRASINSSRPRLLIQDPTSEAMDTRTSAMMPEHAASMKEDIRLNGRLQGVYQHYLLIRPYPSLRILFTSPSLRVPGILQSPFLSRIGGSARIRNELTQALGEGRGVTAKIRWLTRPDDEGEGEGRSRWIHCTPLLGHNGSVGVWMVVLIDDETHVGEARRRFKPAPPVSPKIMSYGEDRLKPGQSGVGVTFSTRSPRVMSYGSGGLKNNPVDHVAAKRNPIHGAMQPSTSYTDFAARPSSRGGYSQASGSDTSFALR